MGEKRGIKSTCKSCHGGCGVLVTVEDGVVINIRGNPDSPTWGTMCAKGLSSIQHINNPHRLRYPHKRLGERGEGKWQRIGWDEALDTIARKMKESIDKYGPNSVSATQGTGRGYNRYTARFGRSMGSINRINSGYFCFLPRNIISEMMVTGQGRLFCDYHGWGGEYPKTQITWPKQLEISNADGEMAPWFLESLKHIKNLILVDPRATALTQRATLWLQIRPGTDAALALGMLNVIINEEIYNKEFVTNWCYGFDKLKERVQEYPPSRVAEITWIPEEKIVRAARMYAIDTPGVIQVGECLETGNNTNQTIRAIYSICAVTGNIERPGGMMCWVPPETGPLENFSREIDVSEENKKTITGGDRFRLAAIYGASPDVAIKEMLAGTCIIKVLHVEGGNPLLYLANTKEVLPALLKLDWISVADLFMSPMAEFADVVLPVAHWLEMDDIYDLHPRFMIGAIVKAVEPPGEAWPDNKIFNELGKRIAPEYWFDNVEEMLDYQLRKANIKWKEFKEIGILARMGKDQPYYKYKTDYWRQGGGFGTPTGKVELYSTIMEKLGYDPLPYFKEPNESPYSTPELYKEYNLILSTGGRLPYYFHSQYRQIPWLRAVQPWPIVQLHTEAAKDRGIEDGDWVWIETPRGRITQKARVWDGIHRKVVVAQSSWYYPEKPGPLHGIWTSSTNILTSNDLDGLDPAFGAPTFRNLLCKVYKADRKESEESDLSGYSG
jgi:anaerobic selenocysteine-containing dehydrogenase